MNHVDVPSDGHDNPAPMWTLLEIFNLAGLLLSPVIAVQVTTWLEARRRRRDRQVEIFRTLMATREQNLTVRHIDALNTIDVEFAGTSAAEGKVREAWKEYLDHLNTGPVDASWLQRRLDRFVELMHSMAQCLGYKMDRTHLKNVAYHPRALTQSEADQDLARKALIALAEGRVSVPVHVVSQQPQQSQLPALGPSTEITAQELAMRELERRPPPK